MIKVPKPRRYYSVRTSTDPNAGRLDLATFIQFFELTYGQLRGAGYLDEAFGSWCVDAGRTPGTAGDDVETYVFVHTRKRLWPIDASIHLAEEEDVFDLIEFLFDHVSLPIEGWHHDHGGCGMHWEKFDRVAGQAEYREAMNGLLEQYGSGFELNTRGEIMNLGDRGMGKLLKASPPTEDKDVSARIGSAIDRFQRYGSSAADRRHAVRDLADVLEKLRPQAREVLDNKDEAALFDIANNFAIRHANEKQKSNYDPAVWLSWVFYFYLATINACLHMLERRKKASIS